MMRALALVFLLACTPVYENTGASADALTIDLDAGTIACSQGIGMIRSVKPVAEVIKDIIAQAEQIRTRIKNM